MAKTTLLTDNWSLGRVSDVPPNRMKPNTAQVMKNWIPDVLGSPLQVRPGWETSYIAHTDFTFFSASTTGISGSSYAPFKDGGQLVFVDQVGRILSLDTSGVGHLLDGTGLATTQGSAGAFHLDRLVLPASDGAHFPWYVSSSGGTASATAFSDPFPKAKGFAGWGAYLLGWAGGDFANSYAINLRRLWFSDPAAFTYTAANNSYWDFPQVSEIMVAVPIANAILVFGPRDCHLLSGDTPPPNNNLIYRPLYNHGGVCDRNALKLWNGYAIYANEHGVYKTDATLPYDITLHSGLLQAWRGDMQNFTSGWTCAMGIYGDWCHITVTDGTNEQFTYVFNLDLEVGFNYAGFPTKMYAEVVTGPHASVVNSELDCVFGLSSAAQAGRLQPIYSKGTGSGADGLGAVINFELQTPFFEVGGLEDKRWRRMYLTYQWKNGGGFNETPIVEYCLTNDPYVSPSWTGMTWPPQANTRQPVFVNGKGRWIAYRIRGGTGAGVQNLALFGMEQEGHVRESSRSS